MADYIAQNFDEQVQIVDYVDGVMAGMLKSRKNINIIEFKDGHPTEVIRNTTLVMQSILPNTIRPELRIDKDTKLLFWTLFHYNLIPDFLPVKGLRRIHHNSSFFKGLDSISKKEYYKKLNLFVNQLHEKSSLYFMDYSTFEITKNTLKLDFSNPRIIPICIKDFEKNNYQGKTRNNITLNVCWVGRIEDFKTTVLQHSINQARLYAEDSKTKINFDIIGYGKDLKKIKSSISNNEYFTANFIGQMDIALLNQYLSKNVDLLMSMGTAALEGGKLGIPTILLDASYGEIPIDYKFRWLFESDGSNVAQFINTDRFQFKGHIFSDIINSLKEKNDSIGEKCRAYVDKYHRIKTVSNQIIEKANKSSFRWGDIDSKLVEKNLVRKIYNKIQFGIWGSYHVEE